MVKVCEWCDKVVNVSEYDICPNCRKSIYKRKEDEGEILRIAGFGYLCAILSLLIFPFFLMIIGIAFGVYAIVKKQVGHGIAIITLSLVLGIGSISYLAYKELDRQQEEWKKELQEIWR